MIRYYCWDPGKQLGVCPVAQTLPESSANITGETVLWIAMMNPTPEEEARVFEKFFPVHHLTLEDITKPRRHPEQGAHLPKVEEFDDYLFVIANPLPTSVCDPDSLVGEVPPDFADSAKPTSQKLDQTDVSNITRPQLSGILTRNLLITHHYSELTCVQKVCEYMAKHSATARRGPDYLFHLILDEMVDEYAPVVERFADRLDHLETGLFHEPSPKHLTTLLRLKRQVVFLRKTLILEREVLARLVRGEFELVQDEEIVYYRNVYDHLVRYSELVESAREMVSDLLQTNLAAVSNRLNEIMKVLTMISTIILPMTLVAGIYGMNFANLPEKDWQYGYPFALGLMLVIGLIALGMFRWKKWI